MEIECPKCKTMFSNNLLENLFPNPSINIGLKTSCPECGFKVEITTYAIKISKKNKRRIKV